MRVPGGGRLVSGADDRITMKADPLFARSRKLPVNVAPAASVMLSPGWAASIAACRSPPAVTAIVRPGGGGGVTSTMARGSSGTGWADAMDGTAHRVAAITAAVSGASGLARCGRMFDACLLARVIGRARSPARADTPESRGGHRGVPRGHRSAGG